MPNPTRRAEVLRQYQWLRDASLRTAQERAALSAKAVEINSQISMLMTENEDWLGEALLGD